jgi:hypothetical protein
VKTSEVILSKSYFNQTTIAPLGVAILVPLCAVVLALPRHFAVMSLLACACFLSDAQRINVGGLDFYPLRVLLLCGLARVLMSGELGQLRATRMDRLFVAFLITGFIANSILFNLEISAIIRRLGELFTYMGCYFLFLCWIKDARDVRNAAVSLAFIGIVLAPFFLLEWSTARNMFSVFGGVPEITVMRDGRLRCQGAFSHPILAGVFWAGAIPLLAILWFDRRPNRLLAVGGIAACIAIIAACSSSTPILGAVSGLMALALFRMRYRMGTVLMAVFCALVVIHFVRERPVWHLLCRINIFGSSTGYHRYLLVDNAINRFDEWWAFGIVSTDHWGHQMFDITNQFLLEGVRGGFLTMLFFMGFVWAAFQSVGRASRLEPDTRESLSAWLVGCALFSHVSSFISVSYSGQSIIIFFLTLACAEAVKRTAEERAAAEEEQLLEDDLEELEPQGDEAESPPHAGTV